MSKWIVDIHGDIEGDYEIIKKYEEQEPCDDVIDRAEAMTGIMMFTGNVKSDEEDIYIKVSDAVDLLRELPPVIPPQPNTGHWIETAEEYYKAINEKGGGINENTPYFTDDIACSECLAKFSVIDNETERFECCPSCGARMVKPQERNDKE